MVSDDMIDEAVRQAIEASQQYQKQLGLLQPLRLGGRPVPAPQLRLNQQGMLEVADPFDEPDTHDEWRSMNAGLAPG